MLIRMKWLGPRPCQSQVTVCHESACKTRELPGEASINSRVSYLAWYSLAITCQHSEKRRKKVFCKHPVCVCVWGMIELLISSSCKLDYLLSFCQRTLRFLVTPVTGSNQECEVKLLANATEGYPSRTYVRSATFTQGTVCGCYSVHLSCSPTSTGLIYTTKLVLH